MKLINVDCKKRLARFERAERTKKQHRFGTAFSITFCFFIAKRGVNE